jgi:hypothetical protein
MNKKLEKNTSNYMGRGNFRYWYLFFIFHIIDGGNFEHGCG